MNTAPIKLLISDVDGTLVTNDKELTPRSIEAVAQLKAAGIIFAITSGRPPGGMAMLVEPLHITTPVAGFNGGLFVQPDMTTIEEHVLADSVALDILEHMLAGGLVPWLYRGTEWIVPKLDSPHVAREQFTVQMSPTVAPDLPSMVRNIVKIVGVSDDLPLVATVELATQKQFGSVVSASRSQPYYLDVTHPLANKGSVVTWMSQRLSIPNAQIATIGDGHNDIRMFEKSGMSIAMGNGSAEVQAAATHHTKSNQEDGFAEAVETLLRRAGVIT